MPPPTNLFRHTPFARPMEALPVSCLDVGSRGGIEPELLPIAFAVDAIGFEPDDTECHRLNAAESAPWRTTRFIGAALAGRGGSTTLHIAEDPVSSSLLPPIEQTGKRFGKTGYATIVGTAEVEAYGLDQAATAFDLPAFDFIKLDTEGIELDILRSGETALSFATAVKVEVSFMPFREGQPMARDVDAFLSECGFELMDLIAPAHWRIHGHMAPPHFSREAIPYSRGQLAHGDYLFLRHPDRMALTSLNDTENAERRLRAAWIAMAYGFFDRAEEYLDAPAVRQIISERWALSLEEALRQTSLRYGQAAWRRSLREHVRNLLPYMRHICTGLFPR